MLDEIENLRIRANNFGSRAAMIHNILMEGVTLPFIKRYELESEMYSLKLEQSKANLRYQQMILWAKKQHTS